MENRKTNPRIQLDAHLKGTKRFWKLLEEHCILDCCGLDALDVSVERILWASEKVNTKALILALENTIQYIESHPTRMFQSRDILCFGGTNEKFVMLFQRVQHILLGISI